LGKKLECPLCRNDKFWQRETLMNTRGMTYIGIDWMNREAENHICGRCGYIFWFFPSEGITLLPPPPGVKPKDPSELK